MFKTFTIALSMTSTIKVTIVNTSSNMICTGILGYFMGENVEIKWWIGATFMLFGTLLLNK